MHYTPEYLMCTTNKLLLSYTDRLLMATAVRRVDYIPQRVTRKGQRESSLGDCYGRWHGDLCYKVCRILCG